MQYNKFQKQDTVQKTIRMPISLAETIESLAIKDERDFSKQLIFMLKKYIEIHEHFSPIEKQESKKQIM